jgi:hypothetical protein
MPAPVLPRRAIIVAGHSVVVDFNRIEEDAGWALLDFQRGEPKKYIEHVRRAAELAHGDPSSLLIFSGGQTRAAAGPRSEAQSYWGTADHFEWFGMAAVRERAITEEFARDSFENLLLGICRFREFTGRWPEAVTLVSWEFKRRRFGLHREAIRWPEDRFSYTGANDPDDLAQALASEQRAVRAYTEDPYSSGPVFRAKRAERNPFRRQHGYRVSCPELIPLFDWPGPERFPGPLPW